MIQVSEVDKVDDELITAFKALVPQLSSSNPAPNRVALAKIVASEASILFVARDESGAIVGSLTLVVFDIPTGIRAWIEDVVVDEQARGRGVGEQLNRVAIQRATTQGATTVDLTSRPSREAANRLYQKLGFALRDTNIYRYQVRR